MSREEDHVRVQDLSAAQGNTQDMQAPGWRAAAIEIRSPHMEGLTLPTGDLDVAITQQKNATQYKKPLSIRSTILGSK